MITLTLGLFCFIVACILFFLAGFGVPTAPTRINLFYLGWAFVILAVIFDHIKV